VVVPEDDTARDEMQQLESQAKVRRYHLAETPLAADAVLAGHERRTLAICNTVARAQALYQALQSHPALGDTQVRLLHSRFLPADRKRIEGDVRRLYAEGNADPERCIVVSTQAIEGGLDITCEHLHTELAPANAILQRAGRCARYKDETGDVHVYGRALGPDGEEIDLAEKPAPYMHQEAVIRATRDALADRDGQPLRFSDEQELVSIVHGPGDRHLVEGLAGRRETHRYKMNAMLNGDSDQAGDLVRDVVSQPVAVYDDPRAMLERPFAGNRSASTRAPSRGWWQTAGGGWTGRKRSRTAWGSGHLQPGAGGEEEPDPLWLHTGP
jgi:CRISPR-associated endonuclease/helicase Cas3